MILAKKENDLGRDPIGKLLLRLALPAIVAQLVNALYNIVDRIYIGHIPGVGDLALTGLGVCFPVLMFVSALSSLAGVGGGARAVVHLGEGQKEKANAILGGCAALLTLFSLLVTITFQLTKEPILLLFGATEETIGYAVSYLSIYLWGTLAVQLSLGLNFFITAQGFSTMSMATVLIGAAINIVLDPIFIFALNMGVKGAALATVIAQVVSALWVLRFLTGRRTRLRLQRRYFRIDLKILAPVVALGISPFIMQSTESLVNIAFNSSLKAYGGASAVGAMTICSSVIQVFALLTQGLTQGAQTIIGFNYGAGQLDRVRKAFRLLLICTIIFCCTVWAVIQFFPHVIVALFNDKPQLAGLAAGCLRIYAAAIFMLGIQNACQQAFVAVGEAGISLFLALLRKIILLIPLILILPRILVHDPVTAVFLAEPVADVLAALTAIFLFLRRFPRILAQRQQELGGTSI